MSKKAKKLEFIMTNSSETDFLIFKTKKASYTYKKPLPKHQYSIILN